MIDYHHDNHFIALILFVILKFYGIGFSLCKGTAGSELKLTLLPKKPLRAGHRSHSGGCPQLTDAQTPENTGPHPKNRNFSSR